MGSLAALPYALAEAEQNFLVPAQTQALIWGDLVPQMILSAKIPRWWNVTPAQVHWVGLHLRYGRELLAEAALDAELARPGAGGAGAAGSARRARARWGDCSERATVKDAVEQVTPSELFLLARDLASRQDRRQFLPRWPKSASWPQASPEEVNYAAISRAFGTPKPTLANSYRAGAAQPAHVPHADGLLQPHHGGKLGIEHPVLGGPGRRARACAPAQLNVRIPEWTQKLVEQIFASHLEDWPAVLKSLRLVGDDVRARSRAPRPPSKRPPSRNSPTGKRP